jgi:hypothetical protein
VIQAWAVLWRAGVEDIGPLESIAKLAADRLVACYQRSQRSDWYWFESQMTYANAVLPHALFDAAERWPDEVYLSIAESSFGFLDLATTADHDFWPIGNRDWYSHGEEKSLYDLQPVEASTMAAAALAGFQARGDDKYLKVFFRVYEWFLGRNSLKQLLADDQSGACFDGLQPGGVNKNQGAESTLAYLWTELLRVSEQPLLTEPADKSIAVG